MISTKDFYYYFSSEMNNYALSEDSSGRKTYVRFNSRAGESVTLSNVRIDSGTMQELTEAVSVYFHFIHCCFIPYLCHIHFRFHIMIVNYRCSSIVLSFLHTVQTCSFKV